MDMISFICLSVRNTIALVLMCAMVFAPQFSAYAQVTNVGFGATTGGLGSAFGNATIDTIEGVGQGVDNAINDATSGVSTGNIFGDAIAQGAADAAGAALSCVAGGFINQALSGTQAAFGLAVPVADGQVAQTTGATQIKECVLDGFAFGLKEGIIKNLIAASITYVNNGFSGGPGYVQNENAYFEDRADQLFEQYLDNPGNFSTVCSAWEADVRLALASQYSTTAGGRRVTQLSGTGTGAGQPVSSGGQVCPLDNGGFAIGETNSDFWGAFLQQTTRTEGNALTSYFNIQETFVSALENEVEQTVRELQRNEGFFDVTYCDDDGDTYDNIASDQDEVVIGGRNCKVTTPGSVINEQLNSALGSDLRRLEQADELNELFSALIGQLINATFSKLGLFGTTQERSGNSNSLLSEYAQTQNPAVVAQSRDVLINLIDGYSVGINTFIDTKTDILAQLFEARDAALGAYVCYGSKYDTWVEEGTNNVIPADQVANTSLSDRERATFIYQQTIGEDNVLTAYLTPLQSGGKVTTYEQSLAEIDSYIAATQSEIDTARLNQDEARLLQQWLGEVNDSLEPLTVALTNSNVVRLISEKFAEVDTSNLTLISIELEDGTLVQVPKDLSEQQLLEVFAIASEELAQFDLQAALNQRRLVEISATDLIEGVQESVGGERIGGYLKDLQQCNLFTQVTARADDSQATSTPEDS